jgi:hypothetical protein
MTESTKPKPYPSWNWVVNEIGDGYWDAPKPAPTENAKPYTWNEEILDWVEVIQQ